MLFMLQGISAQVDGKNYVQPSVTFRNCSVIFFPVILSLAFIFLLGLDRLILKQRGKRKEEKTKGECLSKEESSGTVSQCSSILQYLPHKFYLGFLELQTVFTTLNETLSSVRAPPSPVAWKLPLGSKLQQSYIQLASLVSFLQGSQFFATCVQCLIIFCIFCIVFKLFKAAGYIWALFLSGWKQKLIQLQMLRNDPEL